jgi:hypothetical protein
MTVPSLKVVSNRPENSKRPLPFHFPIETKFAPASQTGSTQNNFTQKWGGRRKSRKKLNSELVQGLHQIKKN